MAAPSPTTPSAAAAVTSSAALTAPAPPTKESKQSSSSTASKAITDITVFTGFLGAGKTTIIMNLIRHLNTDPATKSLRVAWLKNEFGDLEVDSVLAKESNIAVSEILNGCLCCTLVGRLGDAITELVNSGYDRIIVETSGEAFPAPIAWEVRRLAEENHVGVRLDAIVCVIDAVNFKGYSDKSVTAKLQAKYTDLILVNKHELVNERQLDGVMDDVFEVNPDTPKIKTNKGSISPGLVFGLHTKFFLTSTPPPPSSAPVGSSAPTPSTGTTATDSHHHDHHHSHDHARDFDEHHIDSYHRGSDVQVIEVTGASNHYWSYDEINTWLTSLSSTLVYRVKGIFKANPIPIMPTTTTPSEGKEASHATKTPKQGYFLVNHAFGRPSLVPISSTIAIKALLHHDPRGMVPDDYYNLRLAIMGCDVALPTFQQRVKTALNLTEYDSLRIVVR